MATDIIKALQKQIIVKLEAGEDVSELTRRLAQERAKIAAQAEVEQLKKIADERQALRDRAEAVKGKLVKQGEAIDTFLKARDTITGPLVELVEKAKELPKLQQSCYEQYHDAAQLAWGTAKLPEGYLPSGLKVPTLAMSSGVTDSAGIAAEAFFYLQSGLGLLANLVREDRPLPERPATEFEAIEAETEAGSCIVCSHAEVETINNLLGQGKPLRDIEAEFGVSRSSLSRHKNLCLNLGAVRIHD